MPVELMEHQKSAVAQLDSGNILYGGVGGGKSLTIAAYYMEKEVPRVEIPPDVYVITTAKKRDSLDWLGEFAKFGVGPEPSSISGSLTVDSWNNIGRYTDVQDAFFVFDEQRLVGTGAWTKAFYKIARTNRWVLLTATPGDTWLDYAPVFIANGFFKNITEFREKHVIYKAFTKFPVVEAYRNEYRLEMMRSQILVEMPYLKHTNRIMNYLDVSYDKQKWDEVVKSRWNPFLDRPMRDISELFRVVRRIVNTDPSRLAMVKELLNAHPKVIVFYNFDYELEMLRTLADDGIVVAEWNGHKHQAVPDGDITIMNWAYLVQYMSGAEGWNCTSTDAMILWSLTYSYKLYEQALGRIDRLDTPYTDLYYYILGTSSPICRGIRKKLDQKQDFQPLGYIRDMGYGEFSDVSGI